MNQIKITVLGTASPYCAYGQHGPAFFVEYHHEKIMLDCGSGAVSMLKMPDDLQNLSVVLSHYHKDHIADFGMIQYSSFVYNRIGRLNRKVNVYLPEEEYEGNKAAIVNCRDSYCDYIGISDGSSYKIDDLTMTFENNHSHAIDSLITKLQNKDFKVVYTADVGSTHFDELVSFCKDADLIICESTFLAKRENALATHLTAHQAGELAKRAKAKMLMLTHFWPEDDRNEYLEEAQKVFENTTMAVEGKTVVLQKN